MFGFFFGGCGIHLFVDAAGVEIHLLVNILVLLWWLWQSGCEVCSYLLCTCVFFYKILFSTGLSRVIGDVDLASRFDTISARRHMPPEAKGYRHDSACRERIKAYLEAGPPLPPGDHHV